MALYSLVLVREGKPIGNRAHRCGDDLDALDMAYTLCADQTVEIWEADRLVAQVEENDSPFVFPVRFSR